MSDYGIKTGVAVIRYGDAGWFIMDETERRIVTSTLAAELIALIRTSRGDEDGLVATLADRFPAEQVYYALIQLEKQGVIVKDEMLPESPAAMFRAKVHGQEHTGDLRSRMLATDMSVRIISIGRAEADKIAALLARSEVLRVERVADWQTEKMTADFAPGST
jgi:ribosomal protein S12 methylthiotransferase accessory factor